MKNLAFLCFLSATTTFCQSIDYNLKKGFIANGYDVVAYFNNRAVEGTKNFTATYDGAYYKFSSQKNLHIFKQNPEKYVPQFGGYCAYAIAVKSAKVSINPESFKIDDGKLYLFYNAWGNNTLEQWNKENPKHLLKMALKNWEAIKYKK